MHRDTFIHEKLRSQETAQGLKRSKPADQPVISSFAGTSSRYPASHPRQVQINNALIHLIAGDLMPLSTVSSQNFKDLLFLLDPKYQIPDRKTFTKKLLHEKSVEVQSNLKHILKNAECCFNP